MKSKRMLLGTLTLFATAVLSGAAQTPANPSPSSPQTQPPSEAPPAQTQPAQTQPTTRQPATESTTTVAQTTATLVGCLYRESQVPGRKPTVVERAGILEDYILADAAMPAPARPGAPAPVGTTGSVPSTGKMYKVENIADDKLKALVGKRVEVTGKIDPEDSGIGGGPAPDRGPGPDDVNLPEFEAASIKEVSGGTCPATPAAAK